MMLSQTFKKNYKLIVLLLLIKNSSLQASQNNKSGIETKLTGRTVVAATYLSNAISQSVHTEAEDSKEMDSEDIELLYENNNSGLNIGKILNEIKEDQATICNKLNRSKNFHKRLVLVGETGVGKTTLANHLCKTPLEAQENEDDVGQFLVSVAGSISMKSKHENYGIGSTAKSATTIPNFFPFKAYNNSSDIEIPLSVIDCPGTIGEGDTRGKEQTIKNAFYLQTIFNGLGTTSSGIQGFNIALVVKHQELTGRALGLRRALSSMAQLADSNKSVADHILLIITQGHEKNTSAGVARLLEKAKSTLRVDGSQVGINAAKMREAYWSEHLLDTLIASQQENEQNKIFIFPSPAKPGKFKPDTRKQVSHALETISPLQKLEVKIVVPYEIKSDMQEMANTLRFQIGETETAMIKDIQNEFNTQFDFINDLESSNDFTGQKVDQLLSQCLYAIKILEDLEKAINTNRTRGCINIDHDLLVREELSLLPIRLKDFIQCKESTDTMEYIKTNLYQLQCCASICTEASKDSVNYDKVLRSIDDFSKAIKKTEKKLLAHRFKLINQEFQLGLDQLVKTIMGNIEEDQHADLETLRCQYIDFDYVYTTFSKDNTITMPLERIKKFKEMLIRELGEAVNKFTEADRKPVEIAKDQLTKTVDALIDLDEQYGEQLGSIPHNVYITQFSDEQNGYKRITLALKKKIQQFIKEDIQKIKKDVIDTRYAIKDNREYFMSLKPQDIPAEIGPFMQTYKFLKSAKEDYDGADRFAKSWRKVRENVVSGVASLSDSDVELDDSAFDNQDGLKKLMYIFNILQQLKEEKLIRPHRFSFSGGRSQIYQRSQFTKSVEEIREKISQLVRLVTDKNIPEEFVNIQGVDEIVELILGEYNEFKECCAILTQRYLDAVASDMESNKELFMTSTINNTAYKDATKLQIIEQLDTTKKAREKEIDVLRRLIKNLEKEKNLFTPEKVEYVANVVHAYEEALPFFEKYKDLLKDDKRTADLNPNSTRHPLNKLLSKFSTSIDTRLLFFKQELRGKLDGFENDMRNAMNRLFTNIDTCASNQPEASGLLLDKMDGQFSHRTGPWEMSKMINSYRVEYRLYDLNLQPLVEITSLHKQYQEISKHIEHDGADRLTKEFWQNLAHKKEQYPKPGCCAVCCMGCYIGCLNFFQSCCCCCCQEVAPARLQSIDIEAGLADALSA